MRSSSSQSPVVEETLQRITPEYIGGNPVNATERLRYDLVAFCLANWEFIRPRFEQQLDYCVEEAIPPLEFWASKITP